MKFKVGDKVELLYGGNEWPLIGYENGEIYTVAKFPKDVIENHIKNGLIPITGGLQKRGYAKPEQLILVEPKKTKNQRITELEKQVANLLERVEELEKDKSSTRMLEPVITITKKEKTPNQQRAEIIEKAKKFVEEHGKDFNFDVHENSVHCLFAEKKRNGGWKILTGYSKCHPQDVFNEHIGKAIALGRALGLDVSEFERAVQPNEVVVGHRIRRNYFGSNKTYERTVTEINPTRVKYEMEGSWDYKEDVDIDTTIIDDTNAIYEVNES